MLIRLAEPPCMKRRGGASRHGGRGFATKAALFITAALMAPRSSQAQPGPGPAPAPAPPAPPQRGERAPTLTVTGNGEAAGTPDRATVRLGAEAQGPDAMSAQNAVSTIMQKALQQIRAVGIEERRIQTSGLNLYPIYSQMKPGDEQPQRITGYRASNSVQIVVNDLKLVGRVIDAGINAGANQMQGISFDLENDLPQRTEALKQAVQEARTKAEAIAGALGVRLQGIDEVSEGGVNVMPPQPMYANSMMRTAMAVATPVQPGELRVHAAVTIRYRVAPQ